MPGAVIPDDLCDLIGAARRVVALTGAGISAESGVPTFRDAQTGLWAQYDPAELATPEAFARDPALVWRWYRWRRELIAGVAPNSGHRALARWAARAESLVVVTQNVDGLHHQAGQEQVIELHGNITRTRCVNGHVVEAAEPERERCSRCGARLRPDVVWFGEALPEGALEAAERAVREADLVLSVGTSSLVQPAASLPVWAITAGKPVVEINPVATPISGQVRFSLRGKAGELLPALADCA